MLFANRTLQECNLWKSVEILTLNLVVHKVNHTAEDIRLLYVCGVGRFSPWLGTPLPPDVKAATDNPQGMVSLA
jgi:hypothetical protein